MITACPEHRATTGVARFMIGITISGKAYAAIGAPPANRTYDPWRKPTWSSSLLAAATSVSQP
jgi:hypothetical protein